LNTRHDNQGGTSFRVRKQPKAKKTARKFRRKKQPQSSSMAEQPVAESSGTVPCKLCGLLVDRKRLQPHMVRFHGAALR
jgi:hypothetical protein